MSRHAAVKRPPPEYSTDGSSDGGDGDDYVDVEQEQEVQEEVVNEARWRPLFLSIINKSRWWNGLVTHACRW